VADVGPAGRYFEHAHTLAHFEDAFAMPKLFDGQLFEQWQYDGEQDLTARALSAAKTLLEAYVEPELAPAIDEQLKAFVAKREREIDPDAGYNEEH
jgi:trimethylamine--corrinoid protein Co-methyltransferase